MTQPFSDAALRAAPLPHASGFAALSAAILAAAHILLPSLEAGHRIETAQLSEAMAQAFGGTDAQGLWDWKSAYDACEAAQILFLDKYGVALSGRSAPSELTLIERVAALLPTHVPRARAATLSLSRSSARKRSF
ncbi:hypothetical protein EIK56_27630 [Sphingomonas sp. C8-2]|nr:hypothetical protein EIK56_27630 [Sphingomonas sp. C8-2]